MAVSKQAIVDAAITILNNEGADGLSMRTLAQALNVKAAALYNHISGKRELYGAIAEHMCLLCEMPEPAANQTEYLTAVCRAYRVMLLTVRDSTIVMEESLPDTPRRMEIIKLMSGALLNMGVKIENLMTASNMMNNYVLSFVADEVRAKNLSADEVKKFAETFDSENQFIYFGENNYDEQFDYGLRVLFTGLNFVAN